MQLNEKVKTILHKLRGDSRVDSEKLDSWIAGLSLEKKNEPSSYLYECLRELKKARGNLFYVFAKDGITKETVKEIIEEEKDIEDELKRRKVYPQYCRQEWTEPFDPRFDKHPSVFDGTYKGHEEYKEFTFIAVKREADALGTSMHELCRRRGLVYEYLLY